ncbi:hypothetical protein Uis1B_2300 [Bifidobacterium margollesii]|uniref:Macrolide ABC transporter ATP-binding protein n=1 Tax=Bifidobacterium margollesii TaxID=2020964 RepID=A0A2N5J5U7_9BIFI|nr:hypothetical protein [Bifidobacterium margollesii]PLS29589.1 hypothetical protein Uis1B_2300 [Bifidobacterium margollesii]
MRNPRTTPALRPAARGRQAESMERVLAPAVIETATEAGSKPEGRVDAVDADPWVQSTLRMRASTRRRLRALAAERDTTMQELLDGAIRDWLDRQR